MDRGTRRAQKARIRARLRRVLENQIRWWESLFFDTCMTPERKEELRRHIFRNDGKSYIASSVYRYHRCDCGYCVGNRRYRTLREVERIEKDWHELHFGEEG